MNQRLIATLALAGVATLGLGRSAYAVDGVPCGDRPGSLLVYPCFENERGTLTLLTVTNTNDNVVTGTVAVEFIYIDGETCLEFNRSHILTANDTLTVLTQHHNPNMQRGYAYVFAKSPLTGQAIAWDYLIGTNLFLQSLDVYDFETNAIVFQAGEGLVNGAPTDLDGDGIRDLDGVEYSQAPDEILVPRFFGNVGSRVKTHLVLIGLTGARFSTLINFLVYNDNEEVFSTQHEFDCWDKVCLTDISGVFRRDFLLTTNQNPFEIRGLNAMAAPAAAPEGALLEPGWYRMDGAVAQSTNTVVTDPAFLALQIERRNESGVAAVPFSLGTQDNGGLLSLSLMGNL